MAEDPMSSSHLPEDTLLLGRRQVGHMQGHSTPQDLQEVPAIHAVEGLGANPSQQHTHLADVVERWHLGRPARGG